MLRVPLAGHVRTGEPTGGAVGPRGARGVDDLLRLEDPHFTADTVAVVTGAASGIGRATAAAVPNLFEAVEIGGHLHWDGLFSQNPPVNDLMDCPPERKPEELWVIQVNPQTFEGEPSTTGVIADRRTELSGNISLNQELRFIEQVSEWIEAGKLPAGEFLAGREGS